MGFGPARAAAAVAWLVLHATIIVLVATRQCAWVIRRGTALPPMVDRVFEAAERSLDRFVPEIAQDSKLQQVLIAYRHGAGIDTGYGFFAPRVPDLCKVVYQVEYPDGHMEEHLPGATGGAAVLRLTTIMDAIGHISSPAVREGLLRMLLRTEGERFADARVVTIQFGTVCVPDLAQFKRGEQAGFELNESYRYVRP